MCALITRLLPLFSHLEQETRASDAQFLFTPDILIIIISGPLGLIDWERLTPEYNFNTNQNIILHQLSALGKKNGYQSGGLTTSVFLAFFLPKYATPQGKLPQN